MFEVQFIIQKCKRNNKSAKLLAYLYPNIIINKVICSKTTPQRFLESGGNFLNNIWRLQNPFSIFLHAYCPFHTKRGFIPRKILLEKESSISIRAKKVCENVNLWLWTIANENKFYKNKIALAFTEFFQWKILHLSFEQLYLR